MVTGFGERSGLAAQAAHGGAPGRRLRESGKKRKSPDVPDNRKLQL